MMARDAIQQRNGGSQADNMQFLCILSGTG